jgi:hypothetical protein
MTEERRFFMRNYLKMNERERESWAGANIEEKKNTFFQS